MLLLFARFLRMSVRVADCKLFSGGAAQGAIRRDESDTGHTLSLSSCSDPSFLDLPHAPGIKGRESRVLAYRF
jgi:hypothetical protein